MRSSGTNSPTSPTSGCRCALRLSLLPPTTPIVSQLIDFNYSQEVFVEWPFVFLLVVTEPSSLVGLGIVVLSSGPFSKIDFHFSREVFVTLPFFSFSWRAHPRAAHGRPNPPLSRTCPSTPNAKLSISLARSAYR